MKCIISGSFFLILSFPHWIQYFYTTLTLPVIADPGPPNAEPVCSPVNSCPFACF